MTSQLPIQTIKIFYSFLTCTCAPTFKKVPPLRIMVEVFVSRMIQSKIKSWAKHTFAVISTLVHSPGLTFEWSSFSEHPKYLKVTLTLACLIYIFTTRGKTAFTGFFTWQNCLALPFASQASPIKLQYFKDRHLNPGLVEENWKDGSV